MSTAQPAGHPHVLEPSRSRACVLKQGLYYFPPDPSTIPEIQLQDYDGKRAFQFYAGEEAFLMEERNGLCRIQTRRRSDRITAFLPCSALTIGSPYIPLDEKMQIFERTKAQENSGSTAVKEQMESRRTLQALNPVQSHPNGPRKTIFRFAQHLFIRPGKETSRPQCEIRLYGIKNVNGSLVPATLPIPVHEPISQRLTSMLDHNKVVVVVFELLHNGVKHCMPFYGLPSTGLFEDFDAASSIGIRLEWQDATAKKWFTAPLFYSGESLARARQAALEGDKDAALQPYYEATAMLNMLQSTVHSSPPPNWWQHLSLEPAMGPARLKEMVLDHPTQTLRIEVPALKSSPGPTLASLVYNASKMLTKAPEYIKASSGFFMIGPPEWPQDIFWERPSDRATGHHKPPRTTCNTARLCIKLCDPHSTTAARLSTLNLRETYGTDAGLGACEFCLGMFNRPCLFTPDYLLRRAFAGADPDYINGMEESWPTIAEGAVAPFRKLIFHDTLTKAQREMISEISEPFDVAALLHELEISGSAGDTNVD